MKAEVNRYNIKYETSPNSPDYYDLKIGFKYDHHAFRVVDKLNSVIIPRVQGLRDQNKSKISVHEIFQLVLQTKRNDLRRLAYGYNEVRDKS